MTAARGTAGTVIRAVSWLGPNEVERSREAPQYRFVTLPFAF